MGRIVDEGGNVEYVPADIRRSGDVEALMRKIRKAGRRLNGVIHAAGILKDAYLMNKKYSDFEQVIAPKRAGLAHLDEATAEEELDFFIAFSSVAGVIGNPGQSDYAYGNSFMDHYMHYRERQRRGGRRTGKSLSMNWPLWEDGGMRVDGEVLKWVETTSGMRPLREDEGLKLFSALAGAAGAQVVIAKGDHEKIKAALGLSNKFPTEGGRVKREEHSEFSVKTGPSADSLETDLVDIVSGLLKIKREKIKVGREFNTYGFDSINLVEFANALNKKYALKLMPTVFFEAPTLEKLARYLVEKYAEQLGPAHDDTPRERMPSTGGRAWPGQSFGLESHKEKKTDDDPVVIVGMSGRFPGAKDVGEFWRNLKEGRTCISEVPPERWDWRAFYGNPKTEKNKTNIKWGGFIDGVDQFDPLFFGISPREAELMDPQQRFLMEYVWLALEDAGCAPHELAGTRTGIFVGTAGSGYFGLLQKAGISIEGHSSTGWLPSVGPNRMSYYLDTHGPSEPIETACSSSLIAVHRAVEAMQSGSCEMAVAGGVNLIITPNAHISFSKAGMLCEDGRCKTFSSQADGYVRGEGVGMIFLKKLSRARRDGNQIHAIIKGTGENHGGRANSLTAPNPHAQADLLKEVYRKAKIDPRTVTYIEAHGTGTELGDPIEINALKTAFEALYEETGDSRVKEAHCGLGSVKSNIGHLELSAGIAGVIKVLSAMKHGELPATLHCEEINPYIELEGSPFYILQKSREWVRLKDVAGTVISRRAGVSSFGFGGANAHVALEEYLEEETEPRTLKPGNKDYIIVLSAKNKERLQACAEALYVFLTRSFEPRLPTVREMAYTLQTGREAMTYRMALRVETRDELKQKLEQYLEGKKPWN